MAPLKIAVLDDYQGLSKPHFERLQSAGHDVTIFQDTLLPYNHPDTPEDVKEALVKRLEPFSVISSMRERTPFPAELIARLPNLKVLHTTGIRNASIDTQACKERGIWVGGTGKSHLTTTARGPDSTTQHCVALILAITRNIAHDDLVMKSGGWQTDFNTGLSGKVFGTIGLGRLGTSVAKILHTAFGMNVIAWSPNLTQEAADEKARSVGLPTEDESGGKTLKAVSKEELFKTADVVSVHVVLSERSRGMISAKDLSLMKSSAFFVNTSRGPIVVEKDLLHALETGGIRGAALDVFDIEPLPEKSEWRSTKWGLEGRGHVILTPHMGYVEKESLSDWYRQTVENIERYEKGEALLNSFV